MWVAWEGLSILLEHGFKFVVVTGDSNLFFPKEKSTFINKKIA